MAAMQGQSDVQAYAGARFTKLNEALEMSLDLALQSLSDERFAQCFARLGSTIDTDTMRAVRAYALQTMKRLVLEEVERVSTSRRLREKLNKLDALALQVDADEVQRERGVDQLSMIDFDLPEVPSIAPAVTLAQQRVQLKTAEMSRLKDELGQVAAENSRLRRSVEALNAANDRSLADVEAISAQIESIARAVQTWEQQGLHAQ